ncbi:MAG: hypothetical protein GXP31_01715 [Kiritimatiellaeota bacterium]|nr:hypothetical protein [Kiritimatiellota bacterium]
MQLNNVYARAPVRIGLGMLVACLLAAGTGCRSYRLGSLMHPQVRRMAVGQFVNEQKEPRLGILFRRKLIAALMADGSVKVTSPDKADAIIRGRIEQYAFAGVAQGKTRSDANRDRDRDAYQTIIYRATAAVTFSVEVPGRSRPLIPETRVTGQADFTPLPDFSGARRAGLENALSDAARKAAAAVVEAW